MLLVNRDKWRNWMIVRLSGGLGNQLFQYAFGRVVALEREEELLLDDFAFQRDKNREYALQYYPIKAKKILGIRKIYYNSIIYLNRVFRFMPNGQSKFGIYFEKEDFGFEDLKNNKADYYCGCWQNESFFDGIKKILKQELVYSQELDMSKRKVLRYIQENNVVAVHVRHGDYLNVENQKSYEVPSIGYYRRAIEYLQKREKDCKFVFFSDDMKWCKDFFGQEKQCVFFEELENNSAQEDMFFMQQCKHFIIANSSFSWWAAWLGEKTNSIKIAPTKWYCDNGLNERAKAALLRNYILLENE